MKLINGQAFHTLYNCIVLESLSSETVSWSWSLQTVPLEKLLTAVWSHFWWWLEKTEAIFLFSVSAFMLMDLKWTIRLLISILFPRGNKNNDNITWRNVLTVRVYITSPSTDLKWCNVWLSFLTSQDLFLCSRPCQLCHSRPFDCMLNNVLHPHPVFTQNQWSINSTSR